MDVKEQKKIDAGNKLALDTHVGVLMRLYGVSKPVAMARAYAEGPGGLNALISKPQMALPLEGAAKKP